MSESLPVRKLTLLVSWCILVAAPSCLLAQPRIDAGADTVFDFGPVYQGAVVTHQLYLRNRGDAELRIDRAASPCGCTTVEASRTLVPPGDSALLTVRFNSGYFIGSVRKRILVVSNDVRRREYFVYYTAKILRAFDADPQFVYFRSAAVGQLQRAEVRLINAGDSVIHVRGVTSTSGLLELSVSSMAVAPGESALLTVKFTPAAVRRYKEVIEIETDSRHQPKMRMNMVADVIER